MFPFSLANEGQLAFAVGTALQFAQFFRASSSHCASVPTLNRFDAEPTDHGSVRRTAPPLCRRSTPTTLNVRGLYRVRVPPYPCTNSSPSPPLLLKCWVADNPSCT